jgi:hypothetical protein
MTIPTEAKHEVIRQAIADAGSTFVSVNFLKKDGTERHITFNPKDFNEIVGTGSACMDPNIFRIREVNNKEEAKTTWRSFDARRVISIRVRGTVTNFDDIAG